nr:hypothetical protein Itr_chr07CG19280 [Ipomoea trifida]
MATHHLPSGKKKLLFAKGTRIRLERREGSGSEESEREAAVRKASRG